MRQGELTIKRGTTGDAEMLTELSVTTFLEAFAADNKKEDMDKYIAEAMSVSRLTEELADENNIFFLVCYNDELAGYAKLGKARKPEAESFKKPIELERIYVLKKYYNARIGAALMNHCLEYATANQHDVLWLGVCQHNHRAVNFYKKWGFEFYGTHQFVLGDDVQTDELMKKIL